MDLTSAVVTGGGSGLGRAFCEELGARGVRVIVSDIDEVGAAETADRVKRAGGDAKVVRCDVADAAQVDALAEAARAWAGDIDLVINNAGVAVAGRFETVSLADWHWIAGINLWGVVHGCRAFVPSMRARKRGWIINVASAAGLLATPKMAPYNVTKAAVVSLSETLHAELANEGIHVSVLCPTFFQTNIAKSGRGAIDPRMTQLMEKLMARSRIQAPEVAKAALAGVAKNQLYVVPMTDGKTMWRLKRLAPERFYQLVGGRVMKMLGRG
ncbi:MAG TPA: SDR family oxidoreductase [Kofleriaceae bacterium]|jgi:NAD(P)-dependent dehydrogenase (short-subunit alcohol dehydrogenase family)|nr:SDR family oxidoreductase [Kofleriaceae bacterium]